VIVSGSFILHGRSSALNADTANEIAIKLLGEESRKYVFSNSHPDFLRIKRKDGENNIFVDQIRTIAEFLSITSEFGGYKVVVIESAEDLNLNASNSILKILEEPVGNSVIILTTSKLFSLLATVRSRCQKIFVNGKYDKLYSEEDELFKQLIQCLELKNYNVQILPEQMEVFFKIILDYAYRKMITSLSSHRAEKYLELAEIINGARKTYLDHQILVNSRISIVQS
jgi:hypothetical protein